MQRLSNVPAASYVLATMPIDPDQTATIITSRAIRAGYEQDSERWVEELNRHARAAPGYRAAIRLGQTAGFSALALSLRRSSRCRVMA
jgi:antibiotic biosynthesis monooxygenase (ABM) superfamily enzyme